MDDLYEVEESFRASEEEGVEPKWWILKAALADKGNGIRLFSTRQALEEIFEEFEPVSEDEEEEEEEDEGEGADESRATLGRAALFGADTRVDSTQMREWVIQVSLYSLYCAHEALLTPCLRRSTSLTRSFSIQHQIQTQTGRNSTFESTSSRSEVSGSTSTIPT